MTLTPASQTRVTEVVTVFVDDMLIVLRAYKSVESAMASLPVDPQGQEDPRAGWRQGNGRLRAHTLVGAWGLLESAIDDICLAVIADANTGVPPGLSNVRVPLSSFLSLSEGERGSWVLEQIKAARSSSLKAGIGQFESLLEGVGAEVPVDEFHRRALFAVKMLRNAIAHRGGRADDQFINGMPGWNLTPGDHIEISLELFIDALMSIADYLAWVGAKLKGAQPPTVLSTIRRDEILARLTRNAPLPSSS